MLVWRLAALVLLVAAVGCASRRPVLPPPLRSPYPERRIVAVAPLRNESGSLAADAVRLADHLTRALEEVLGLDAVPVNRVLSAMDALGLGGVATPEDAHLLREALGADAIVVGTVTAYDPYDPPTLGLTLELFGGEGGGEGGWGGDAGATLDVRALSGSGTDVSPVDSADPDEKSQTPVPLPLSRVSAVLDASDGRVRAAVKRYASTRGPDDPETRRGGPFSSLPGYAGGEDDASWRRYRLSMDLYSEFAAHEMVRRLMRAETLRLAITGSDGGPFPPP